MVFFLFNGRDVLDLCVNGVIALLCFFVFLNSAPTMAARFERQQHELRNILCI